MRRLSFLKPALVAISLVALPVSAAETSPELVEAWRAQASDLHTRLSALTGPNVPDIMRLEISRFGRVAGRIAESGTLDAPLPDDLACIFRGMEEETEVQLTNISRATTDEELANAKARLLSMFEDAMIVGEATELSISEGESGLKSVSASGKCSAPTDQ